MGTGNYHAGTARLYDDLGLLTADPTLCRDVALLFNQLTGALRPVNFEKLIVAPYGMRERFVAMIRREADHARQGRPCGIRAKMNQLQDQEVIRELYAASQAGVPIRLVVRGLCCLRPGVPGLSDTIEVFSVVGRFLEHSRVYWFANGGKPDVYIGSADLMPRNLDTRVELVAPVDDPVLRDDLLDTLERCLVDECNAWDLHPDRTWVRRTHGRRGGCVRARAHRPSCSLTRSMRSQRSALAVTMVCRTAYCVSC